MESNTDDSQTSITHLRELEEPRPKSLGTSVIIVAMAVSIAIYLLSAIDITRLFLLLITVGISYLLFIANNNLLVYSLMTIVPALAAYHLAAEFVKNERVRQAASVLAALAVFVTGGYVIPNKANEDARAKARQLVERDVPNTVSAVPPAIEIQLTALYDQERCTALCQTLLATREFAFVRVKQFSVQVPDRTISHDYSLVPTTNCKTDPRFLDPPIESSLRDLQSQQLCVVQSNGGKDPLPTVIRVGGIYMDKRPQEQKWIQEMLKDEKIDPFPALTNVRFMEILQQKEDGDGYALKFRKTEVTYERVTLPIYLGFASDHTWLGPPAFGRTKVKENPLDLVPDALSALGLSGRQ